MAALNIFIGCKIVEWSGQLENHNPLILVTKKKAAGKKLAARVGKLTQGAILQRAVLQAL
jgi:hypothetical protein